MVMRGGYRALASTLTAMQPMIILSHRDFLTSPGSTKGDYAHMARTLRNNDVEGNPYRIRDPRNSSFIELWLISAVVTVLVIRLYLYLTGYPQVGGDTLHIAHMLWGGLGLVIAFGMLLLFADSVWKPIAALIGGIGFGAFIDELGKFITKDNDYFYEPTIALIYSVFIVLYFLARYFDRKRKPTEADHLYLAAQAIAWQAIGKMDKRRQAEALENLNASGNKSPLAEQIRATLENAEVVEYSEQSRVMLSLDRIKTFYWKVVDRRWMLPAVIALFAVRAIEVVVGLIVGITSGEYDVTNGISIPEGLSYIAGFFTGFLAVYGLVMMMRRHREKALRAFAGSTVVALLFGQFFAFSSEQLLALGALVTNLIVLGVLRLALIVETDRSVEEGKQGATRDSSVTSQTS